MKLPSVKFRGVNYKIVFSVCVILICILITNQILEYFYNLDIVILKLIGVFGLIMIVGLILIDSSVNPDEKVST